MNNVISNVSFSACLDRDRGDRFFLDVFKKIILRLRRMGVPAVFVRFGVAILLHASAAVAMSGVYEVNHSFAIGIALVILVCFMATVVFTVVPVVVALDGEDGEKCRRKITGFRTFMRLVKVIRRQLPLLMLVSIVVSVLYVNVVWLTVSLGLFLYSESCR